MRPRRLEVEGFTAFRDRTVVDFEDADLFAFVGPTGSGKSSLVDAILFALYGIVPRYGDKRAVEPVVSLGKNEARIRFDFTVGATEYTAARVVRRTKTGATTAEARLEGGPDVILGADEVTDAVEGVLGLGFDHFTKCVVLPQGQFAAFLHDPASKRQELLRQLLDLGRYRLVREFAVERQRGADNRVEVLDQQLADLAFATEEAMAAAVTRRQRLVELLQEVEEAGAKAEEAEKESRRSVEAADKAENEAALVASVVKPADLGGLSNALQKATAALEAARRRESEAAERLAGLEEKAAGIPDRSSLERTAELHARRAKEQSAGVRAAADVELAEAAVQRAQTAAAESTRVLDGAEAALAAARRQHAAHDLSAHLEPGRPCPVCLQTVEELPPVGGAPPELASVQEQAATARLRGAEAIADLAKCNEQLASARARDEELKMRVSELTEQLAGMPSSDEVTKLMSERRQLDELTGSARVAAQTTRTEVDEAQRMLEQVGKDVERARREFDVARDRVAPLAPPAADRESLEADWEALVAWARSTSVERRASAEAFRKQAAGLREESERLVRDTAATLRSVDIRVDDRSPRRLRDVCVEALAAAGQEVERLEGARAKAAELTRRRAGSAEEGAVAKTLARHLAANGFEAWLMEEALESLIAGANQRLDELSAGAYSLELDKRDFRIVDHRNADERRSVKTLSGGETFLVSLALALALAEHLASMSVHGVARLESMFLDEGFGTLDVETLDVVATVIHELGSDGRTIGLITHVKDLAEQVPVRFEVRKGPAGATVERVDA